MAYEIDLRAPGALAAYWKQFLHSGGAFLTGVDLPLRSQCRVVLLLPSDEKLELTANVVMPTPGGVGVELEGFAAARAKLAAMIEASAIVTAPPPAPPGEGNDAAELAAPGDQPADDDPPSDQDPDDKPAGPDNVYARLRNLTVAEQHKVAREGDTQERVVLERIYGKMVWEILLRNSRITMPEVSRIARMGSLPRPLVEIIVGNAGWLKSSEVRRALLSNARLGTDQALRVLRLMSKHELKLVPTQTTYPAQVRDAARKLLKEGVG